MNFPQPAAGNGIGADFGTDGGVHNFLRYIEAWGNGSTLSYRGSLVSLYYSQYAGGIPAAEGGADPAGAGRRSRPGRARALAVR